MQENRKRKMNWSSTIGWLIFILVIAGGPIFNLLRRALSGVVTLPPNMLPLAIGGLVALSILVSVLRALGSSARSRGDSRLPTSVSPQSSNAPMPPFAGPARSALPTSIQPTARPIRPPLGGESRVPVTPRFEPIINPLILVLGIVGLLVLVGVGLLLFIPSFP
jgi:hypothetical protein